MQAEVDIQYVGREGQGVGADAQKNLYFVVGAVPGDRVLVEFEVGSKRYRDAKLLRVIKPSADRIASVCPYFLDCGGCDWLNWDYAAQLQAKQNNLQHVLSRADLHPEMEYPIEPAKNPLAYRTRVQLRRDQQHLGYFRRQSNDVVPVTTCAVAHPAINALIVSPENLLGSSPLWKKVELSLEANGEVSRVFDAPHGELGFTQVNAEQNLNLQRLVASAVKEQQSQVVLELFCGDANLTAAYLPLVKRVLGVDLNPAALSKALSRTQALQTFTVLKSAVDPTLLPRLPPDIRGIYDTLILDPPRSGVGKALRTFIHPALKTIIYVSCSPITFSQDAQCFLEADFQFQSVRPLDMFPQTRHLELVAVFVRP